MKRPYMVAAVWLATTAPLCAQTATGVGFAKSDSTAVAGARATAIGGGQGVGIGTGGNPQANVTIQGNPASTVSTVNNTGTSTIKNVPSVFSPGLAAAGLETCLGSVSGGGAFVGTGFSFGTTIPDPGCAARLDARTLWSMGLKKAAVARLCLNADIARAMPEICVAYLPQAAQPVGYGSFYLSADQTYQGGPIMLTDGNTGKERLCNDYNASRQRCRVWAGEKPIVVSHRKVAVQAAPQEDKTK